MTMKLASPDTRQPGRVLPGCVLVLFFFLIAFGANAQEWPRFRGPNGSGNGKADIPAQWSEANRKWSVKLPGVGHGSPVVWAKRVFLLCGDESTGRRTVLCVDAAEGRTLWQRNFDALANKQHK